MHMLIQVRFLRFVRSGKCNFRGKKKVESKNSSFYALMRVEKDLKKNITC
jgi:hypothetical protein